MGVRSIYEPDTDQAEPAGNRMTTRGEAIVLIREPFTGQVKPLHVTLSDAAKILGTTIFETDQLIADEEITAVEVDGRCHVVLASVEAYAKRLEESQA